MGFGGRLNGALCVIVLALSLGVSQALAWGHLKDFGVRQISGSLIFDVLEEGSIGVCVESDDPRYTQGDLEILVEASLTVWLDAVRDLIDAEVSIEEDCNLLSLDLLILFGAYSGVVSPDGAADIAFKTRVHRGANFFSVIGFNTVGTNAARGEPLVFMSPLDFLDEDLSRDLSRGEKLAYLEAVSQDAPSRLVGRNFDDMARLFEGVADDLEIALLTRDAVAAARDIDDNPIDILPVMIHEFGHGFGLCDMRPAAYEVSCNRQYRTELTRASIMAFGGYKLRRDDVEGIRSLFERFIERPFLDQRIFGDDDRRETGRFDRSLVEIGVSETGSAIGYFAGNCRTIATAGQNLTGPGPARGQESAGFTIRPVWTDEPVPVEWPAAGAGKGATAAGNPLSTRTPERDFALLTLSAPIEGCEPLIVDPARADQVINDTGSFTIISLGGFGQSGRLQGTVRAQDSSSCAILRRDFGNKYYQDPLTFVTDCDLTRGNAGSPVIHLDGDERILLGMAVGADRLAQNLRRERAYLVPGGRALPGYDKGPTFRGQEGNITGANLFLRLNGPFLDALATVAE
ncbi:MAG: hypothetical protein O7A03_02695 [Alphaproteobacteria bacterium]|nr:hypothetical protein [Alphaproteobacteria bacterium]